MLKLLPISPLYEEFRPIHDQWIELGGSTAEKVWYLQRQFVWECFCPFALSVVRTFSMERLGDGATIPAPPADRQPSDADRAAFLCGTADTLVAGKRIIFWAAAALSPEEFRRGVDSSAMLNNLLDEFVTPSYAEGSAGFMVDPEPVSWIADALKSLEAAGSEGKQPAQDGRQRPKELPEKIQLLGTLRERYPYATNGELAKMMKDRKYPMQDYTVSRYLKRFNERRVEFGLPPATKRLRAPREYTVSPDVFDMGERQGGNKHRVDRHPHSHDDEDY